MNLKYLQQNNPKKSSIKTKQKLGIINEKGVIAVPETEDEIITEIWLLNAAIHILADKS